MSLVLLPEVAAGIINCRLAHKEKRSSSGNVEGGDEKGLESVHQGEHRSIFPDGILLEQVFESPRRVLGPVKLSHCAVKGIIPPRAKDVTPIFGVKLTTALG